MKNNNTLSLDIIEKARAGDNDALTFILNFYNRKISALATYTITDTEGKEYTKLDEDMKAQLQITLVQAIKNWRELI